MIVVKLNGGLGNQMFQYAFGRSLSDRYNQSLCLDCSEFEASDRSFGLSIFSIPSSICYDIEDVGLSLQQNDFFLYEEKKFQFDKKALNALTGYKLETSVFILSGYWQSPKYFSDISSLIRQDFKFNVKIAQGYMEIEGLIRTTLSVMVHVRRGDYLYYGNLTKHGVVSIDYIQTGINYYRTNYNKPVFFIFSDDPEWCKAHIEPGKDVMFIQTDNDEGRTSFQLMSKCKLFLISNSTYSWWAAWLGEYPNKEVISPKKWFVSEETDTKDLIPSDWRKM